jgi:uncharacterized membrane protein (DUF485 family)
VLAIPLAFIMRLVAIPTGFIAALVVTALIVRRAAGEYRGVRAAMRKTARA